MPTSIAGRLTLMFAVATGLVSALAGTAIFMFQTLELKRHQAEELRARFEIVETMVRHLGGADRWPMLADKLTSFTPANDSIRYRVESPDPRFAYGAPWPAGAQAQGPREGVGYVRFDQRRFMTLSQVVPPYRERPAVRLTIAADTAPFDASGLVLGVGVLTASLLTVAAVSLLGRRIAKGGLAPVDRLSRHAAALNPDDLSLRMPTQRLPAELKGLMAAFNGALDRLQNAYVRLSSFNADVAHELRTPLSNLIGQTQVALSRTRRTDELEEVLHSNLEELERLRTIINDMLFLARADQGAMAANLAPTSLAALVRKTADFLDVLLEEAGVTLRVEGDATIAVEESLLGRAMTNLLDNAIRHGAGPGLVTVTIEDHGDQVCIGVRNHGTPIHEAHLARLFDRFYRLDPARENSGDSHGLGLAVVKAVASMHCGSVFARCENGEVLVGLFLKKRARAGLDDSVETSAPRPAGAPVKPEMTQPV
ncbi:heavy metal sensor histidine kinase [Caulobacter sp. Root655]|uniref:heavy metal sensor histidine kinase n=1 Tax=Caulobacter sp. Root655 TaxID=1736578 RepID=UPI000A52A554|nr:heavy metal sensor histidine kinase [Caulobacter sp. Root655]